MSLQYIIDGYNIINHPLFKENQKIIKDSRAALLKIIKTKRLCGSPRNKVIIVFDGYPQTDKLEDAIGDLEVIFSRNNSADEKIKKMVENCANPKNIIVVSDDKEIKFFIRTCGARPMSAEEFLAHPEAKHKEPVKPELTFTQMHKINQELRKLWLE